MNNKDRLLLRQIHPNFVQAGAVSSGAFECTSSAFMPTAKDQDKLSVYNGDKFDGETAYHHFIESNSHLGVRSAGVFGVTESECATKSLPTGEDNDPFDGHSFIDFSGKGSSTQKGCAKALKRYANERGWIYQPVS